MSHLPEAAVRAMLRHPGDTLTVRLGPGDTVWMPHGVIDARGPGAVRYRLYRDGDVRLNVVDEPFTVDDILRLTEER